MESNKLWYLKRINLFRCLSADEAQHVQEVAEHRLYQRRQLVFGPEDLGDAIYLIQRGRVKLSRFDEKGKEITLAILEEGEFFGEEALAGSARREGLAEALDETLVCRLARPTFESLMAANQDLALTVARQTGERLLGARSRLASLACRDASARLAATLLELADRYGEVLDSGRTRIAQRITHQELAALIAAPRETTTTLLGKFEREGWIETGGRSILLVDTKALEDLARSR